MAAAEQQEFVIGKNGERRVKGRTIVVPVVTGTCAFWLGKKVRVTCCQLREAPGGCWPDGRRPAATLSAAASGDALVQATEYQSHKWTVYLRSPNNDDMQHVLKKVTFVLHDSFANPERDQAYSPYELTEVGWGEFDILVRIHFHDDVAEPPVELYHRLKLYGDDAAPSNAKKPVVAEQYEELVFWEPTEPFFNRVAQTQRRPAPPSQVGAVSASGRGHRASHC